MNNFVICYENENRKNDSKKKIQKQESRNENIKNGRKNQMKI